MSKNFALNFFLQITASDFASSLLTTTRLLRRDSLVFLVIYKNNFQRTSALRLRTPYMSKRPSYCTRLSALQLTAKLVSRNALQKGGVPATPSGTATLLRLSPSHQFCPRTLLPVTYFRHPRLPWLDGRCVQGPGTYSPRHG